MADEDPTGEATSDAEVRDALPEDLNVSEFVGPYVFPNNNRRRVPGYLYILIGLGCIAAWVVGGSDGVLVNAGFLAAGISLLLIGAYHLIAGWNLDVDERDALVAATDGDGDDLVVLLPAHQHVHQFAHHGQRQRVQRLGAVQGNQANAAFDFAVYVFGIDRHGMDSRFFLKQTATIAEKRRWLRPIRYLKRQVCATMAQTVAAPSVIWRMTSRQSPSAATLRIP